MRIKLKYTCDICGWTKENEGSHHVTSSDFNEIFEHEKTHNKGSYWEQIAKKND
jgi:hypothetical protein